MYCWWVVGVAGGVGWLVGTRRTLKGGTDGACLVALPLEGKGQLFAECVMEESYLLASRQR